MNRTAQTGQQRALWPTSLLGSLWPILAVVAASALVLVLATLSQPYFYVVFTADVYLPVHYFLETASFVVGFSIFAVYWHASRVMRDAQGIFIGTAFFAVAAIDVMHALSFPGMPEFVTPSSVDKGILYWLSFRLWLAFSLLVAAFVDPRSRNPLLRRGPLLGLNVAVTTVVFVVVSFFPDRIPPMFVAGHGLSPLKIGLEYLVVALAVAAALVYLRAYLSTGNQFFKVLTMGLIVTVFSELSFTLYAAAYDTYNLLGHVYEVISYYFIFSALFGSAVRRPYMELQSAFSALDVKNRELKKLNDMIENQLERTIAELRETAQISNRRVAQLDGIIDSLTEGVVIADVTGRIMRCNPAAAALHGFKSPDEMGSRVEELASLPISFPDGRPVTIEEQPISKAIRGERFVHHELVSWGADGVKRCLVFSGCPIKDESGQIVLGLTVSRDVTEERELDRLKDEFFSIASHELRTPLTSIKGFAQLLARRLARESGREEDLRSLEVINHQADSMQELIEELLDVTRIQSGRFELSKNPFDLARLASEVVEKLQITSDKHSLRLKADASLWVNADRHRIEEVFTNLISNAIKYSPEGGPVDIVARRSNGEALVSCRDYGAGIPKEKQPFIFQRFYRAASGPCAVGLGLGLYITRGIIEGHRGRIWFESPPREAEDNSEKGSIFYFCLPIFPVEAW